MLRMSQPQDIVTSQYFKVFIKGFVYFFVIFIPKRCKNVWGFSVYTILYNPLEYPSQKYSTMI
jgi:hypothetical protein